MSPLGCLFFWHLFRNIFALIIGIVGEIALLQEFLEEEEDSIWLLMEIGLNPQEKE